jgi:hypothetical protein
MKKLNGSIAMFVNRYRSENPLILSRRARLSRCIAASSFVGLLALSNMISLQAEQPGPSAGPSEAWHSDQATELIGLAEVKAKTKGSLSLSPTTLIFTTPEGSTTIDRAKISTVAAGDVRMEMGGTAGKITRAVIPFGGGSALATVTNKQVGLLTIQFRDEHNALHGAVFLLPKNEAVQAQQQFDSPEVRAQMEQPQAPCAAGRVVSPNSIKVASIATLGEPVPAEYRVLLYEELLLRLQQEGTFAGIYRDGDNSTAAACPEYTLTLTLSAFNKGNAALRASTGPVGYFVGATTLRFHALVQGLNGETLLDKDFKVSKRGDSESLDVTDKIAKSLSKKLKKANEHPARS